MVVPPGQHGFDSALSAPSPRMAVATSGFELHQRSINDNAKIFLSNPYTQPVQIRTHALITFHSLFQIPVYF